MKTPFAARQAPFPRSLALAFVLLPVSAPCVLAQANPALPASTVVISGARFEAASVPIGATLITADDIRRAGVADLNAAIRKVGGVFGRQSLDASPDFGLDLRGFGANSVQNTVILVDGVRLNENELANTVLSSIPVDSVERIEITRGGSSVLYGDGATGGVINIITRAKAAKGTHGTLFAEAGSFDQRELRAALRHGVGAWAFDVAATHLDTDGYRANSRFAQRGMNAGVQRTLGVHGRVGVRFEHAQTDSRLPGALSEQQFENDPRASSTPDDFGSTRMNRVTAFIEQRVGAFDLAAELSHRDREVNATYVFGGWPSALRYDTEHTQFSPRLRHTSSLAGSTNEVVAGIDLARWTRDVAASWSGGQAQQESRAVYLRDELRWQAPLPARLAVGVRHERFEKEYADPLGYPPVQEQGAQSLNAWSVEGSVELQPEWTMFAKLGRSFRMANIDENTLRASTRLIDPQTSRDLEFGLQVGPATRQATLRVFRHALRDEIFYDPTIGWGINTNLDPTRRQGLELEGKWQVARAWRVSGQWQRVQAEFKGGANAGREMVLVPKQVLTARLAYTPAAGHSVDVGAQWVDRQRYGDDFTNACSTKMAAYTSIDARYARQFGDWEWAIAGMNLADRRHTSNAYSCRAGIYPGDGRQLKLSVRYAF